MGLIRMKYLNISMSIHIVEVCQKNKNKNIPTIIKSRLIMDKNYET